MGTNPTETRVSGMHHLEGGWGKEINNPQDPTERKRGTDKLKGVSYPPAVERMVPNATRWIEQNNSGVYTYLIAMHLLFKIRASIFLLFSFHINRVALVLSFTRLPLATPVDMYETFFKEVDSDTSFEPPSVKTLSVLRDPNDVKRSATNICWHPDGSAKLAVSYSVMQFQKMPASMPTHSYVWDVNNPNDPEYTITPPSPACALAFNPKSPDMLVGGLYNGLIGASLSLSLSRNPRKRHSRLGTAFHIPLHIEF